MHRLPSIEGKLHFELEINFHLPEIYSIRGERSIQNISE